MDGMRNDKGFQGTREKAEWDVAREFTSPLDSDGWRWVLAVNRMKMNNPRAEPRFSYHLVKRAEDSGKVTSYYKPLILRDGDNEDRPIGVQSEGAALHDLFDQASMFVRDSLMEWVDARNKLVEEEKARREAKKKRHEDNLARRRIQDQKRAHNGSGDGGGNKK